MLLHLLRDPPAATDTTGQIVIPSARTLYTIERPWLDNDPDVSCVPVGAYGLIPFLSPIHGLVYRLHNPELNVYGEGTVPAGGRDEIELHPLNFARESKGCIGPGLSGSPMFDPVTGATVPSVQESQAAMVQLRGLLGADSGHTLVISSGLSHKSNG